MELQQHMRNTYGLLSKIPGIFGRRDLLFSGNPDVYEKVYSTEGKWPIRRFLEVYSYYRKQMRPDVFDGLGGLLLDQDETWASMRTAVNQLMMQPQVVKSYVPVVDEVAREFLNKMDGLRDRVGEMPADFANELGLWAIEALGTMALDRRMGVLENNHTNEDANQLVNVFI